MKARVRRPVMYLLLAVFVIVSISMSALAGSLWNEWRLVNVPLHATIEALGGLSAVVIALFLLQRQEEASSAKRFPLAMGFLGMGLLDTFHAMTTPGHGFVLLHSVASLVGGSCFALVWLPDRWIRNQTSHQGWLSRSMAIGAISFGAWTLAARQTLPVMTRGDEFTATAVGLNLLAGAYLHALLHDEIARHRPRLVNGEATHRGSPRPDVGGMPADRSVH